MANTHSTLLTRSSSQYWGIADTASLDFTGNFTITFWVRPNSTPTTEWAFASKYTSGGNQRSWVYNYEDNAGTKRIHVRTSSDGTSVTEDTFDTTLSSGTWYHLAFAYNTAGTIGLYINGSLSDTMTATTSLFNSSADFQIGSFNAGDWFFDGNFNDIRVYSATLDATAIGSVYTTPCTLYTTNLVSQWFISNTGNDQFGSNNLTGVNSPTFSTDVAYSCSVGPTNVASWNGVTAANISTYNGTSWANVDSINSVT